MVASLLAMSTLSVCKQLSNCIQIFSCYVCGKILSQSLQRQQQNYLGEHREGKMGKLRGSSEEKCI